LKVIQVYPNQLTQKMDGTLFLLNPRVRNLNVNQDLLKGVL